jgi:hypothetical protein
MFASKSVGEHLLRGAVGVGTLLLAVSSSGAHVWMSLAALPVALIAFRGCPTCWTMGLVETVAARVRGKTTARLCADGTCPRSGSSLGHPNAPRRPN